MEFRTDRTIDSTDTNEYAEGLRDETLWEKDETDTERSLADMIPDAVAEDGENDRPLYEESGYENDPGK